MISTGTDLYSADQRQTAKRKLNPPPTERHMQRKGYAEKERQEERRWTETLNRHTV